MTELLVAVICCAVLLALGICCRVALDRFHAFMWRWRNPPEKLAAERSKFERRLLNPDWKFYEQYLQRPVPASLRELFANHDLILGRQHVEFISVEEEDSTGYISEFWPLDEQTLRESREYGINAIPFAYGEGLLIYLRPGPSEANADDSDRSQSSRHIPCAVHRIPRRITVARTAHGVCLLLLSETSMLSLACGTN